MRHEISHTERFRHLLKTIIASCDGDTIICHSIPMVEIAERAVKRMYPDKKLTFVLEKGPYVDI